MAYNQTDQNDYFPYAQSNSDFGICVSGAANGVGLATRGLVWQGFDVWWNVELASGISTAWSVIAGYSMLATAWTAPSGYSGLATTWTLSSGGLFSEYPQP